MKKIATFAGLTLFVSIFHTPVLADNKAYVMPENGELHRGRDLWLENCEGCHGYGIADAPIPMQPDQWQSRIRKGKVILYEHAINGFMGPDYSMMPARGGNEALNDSEVRLAVDYMVFLAGFYIQQQGNEVRNNDSTTN